MMRLTASALAAAALTGSVVLATDPLGCNGKSFDTCKDTKGCKWAKQLEFCYNKSLGEPEDQTPAPETPIPTAEPTEAPTDAPTALPTETPTDAPTAAPVEPVVPEGPFTQADCTALGTKSQCNWTPTCVFKVQEETCAGCPDLVSRNSCDRIVGCAWRQKACQADDSVPHPLDDECAVHLTKRHCRAAGTECQWMRNGKCKGHRGCGELRNNIDCRGASECYWMPNKNECVELGTDDN